MSIDAAGLGNLAGFVRATAGRCGASADVRGGVVVAGPVAVVHGYVDAAFPTDLTVPAAAFIDAAMAFFGAMGRSFVLWAPNGAPGLVAEAHNRGLVLSNDPAPAMVVAGTVVGPSGVRCEMVTSDDAFSAIGDLCERGYQQPGMAWLMGQQQSCRASGSAWFVAFDDAVPVSTACAFRTSDTGGVYSVATPPEYRGRGSAAAVTAAATNHLVDLGVTSVVLQASRLGFGIYERLGFRTYDLYQRFTIPSP